MQLRALIVDDEYPAREELRFLLSKYKNINVVGEASSVSEAFTLIQAIDYHIVFLDINFPKENGIDIGLAIQKLPNPPCIVYVTAHESYAINAFEVDAIDYILKPIDPHKLNRAIERIMKLFDKHDNKNIDEETKEEIHKEEDNKIGISKSGKMNRLTAELNGKIKLLDTKEIYYAYTEDNYVFIKTYDSKLITKFTLTALEEKLDKDTFFRTHRSYLVNLDKVIEILPFFNGTYSLLINDKEHSKIPVSRNQTKELRKLLGL